VAVVAAVAGRQWQWLAVLVAVAVARRQWLHLTLAVATIDFVIGSG
jgi:hypothetical protein